MYTNPFGAFWDLTSASDTSNERRLATGSSGLTYGALPLADNPSFMKFTFNSHRTGILNSNVTGPNTLVYFNISSSSTTTTVSRKSGDIYATVEWTRHPMMQIYGVTGRIPTSHWISLSPDRKSVASRFQYFFRLCASVLTSRSLQPARRGNQRPLLPLGSQREQDLREYVPSQTTQILSDVIRDVLNENLFFICLFYFHSQLYGDDDETATISGEIAHISRTDGEVSLNISLVAFNNGFLDTCVLATVLFMSGRNID